MSPRRPDVFQPFYTIALAVVAALGRLLHRGSRAGWHRATRAVDDLRGR